MTPQLIDTFADGGAKLRAAVRGLSPQEMQWRPAADQGIGLWTIHEIVIHLQDSDAVLIDRMKRIIAEECPLLIGFDESRYRQHLHCHEQSAEDALVLFETGRRNFARVLRRLPEPAFARRGIHNQRGEIRLGQVIQDCVNHLDNHLKYVHLKRQSLGKP